MLISTQETKQAARMTSRLVMEDIKLANAQESLKVLGR